MAQVTLEGIEEIKGPVNQNRIRGRLSLPKDFPSHKLAVKWVRQGFSVATNREAEFIQGPGGKTYKVNGWEVWTGADRKPCVRTLSDGPYVLMVRPLVVQQNLGKICGNLSRERLKNEAHGRTVGGAPIEDSGVLTDRVLSHFERPDPEHNNDELDAVSLNQLSTETVAVTSRAKPKIKSK